MAFYCVTTCFNCIIISQSKYSFLSKQSVITVHKRTGFLSLNQISELVWDSGSYEAGTPSYNSSEGEGGFEDEPGVSHLQLDQPTTRGHVSSNSFSSNASDEEEIFQSWPFQQVQTPSTSQWTWPWPSSSVVHALEGAPGAKRQ
jgi:hypothetical protein